MNWWVVIGENGGPHQAIVCAEYALNWVRDEMTETYENVTAIPVEQHWTAQILHRREGGDYCVRSDE